MSAQTIEPYMVVYLKSNREKTKQKTSAVRGTVNPVWNKSMPFYNLKYDSEQLIFELKCRKSLAENPTLGEFVIDVKEVMVLAGETSIQT
jgi:Ca2+-dependent lipid-binding protein